MQSIVFSKKNLDFTTYLKEIYEYKSLIWTFAIRDIKLQYSQTFLGVASSLLQAILGTAIMSFFFGSFFKINTGSIPYPVFLMPGMLAWYYFSYVSAYAGTSVIQAQHIIKKVYFPKLVLPFSKAIMGLVDFFIWLILFFILCIVLKQAIYWHIVFLPLFILMNVLTALSIALWLAALTVRFRDLNILIPYLIGFGVFVTPVFFPTTMISQQYHFLLYLNPMAGVISGFRWCLLGLDCFSGYYFIGFILVCILFISGLIYFKKVEGIMSDIL